MSLSTHFRNHLIHGGVATALPRLELMPYHADTIKRWRAEGLPDSVQSQNDLHTYFGLDPLEFFFLWPDVDAVGCREKITTPAEFDAVRKQLYSLDAVARRMEEYSCLLASMREQNGILWVPLHGFFWHPRDLFGVAEHMMMFYDEPELMHEINRELLEFNIGAIRMMCEIGVPDIICVSEDMAYKSGSMISREMFDEFMAENHRVLAAEIKKQFCVAAVDTDGLITEVTPWMAEVGYQCINPMERQTGMDLLALREGNPGIAFMGGYNKLVMCKGREAIEVEWASLEPLFKKGKFLPAVDHQTPPEVSLENYRHYLAASQAFFQRMGVGR